MKNNKRMAVALLILVVIFATLVITVDAYKKEIADINEEIQYNSTQIEQIGIVKTALHDTANILREYEHLNDGFSITLGEKWSNLHNAELLLTQRNKDLNTRLSKLKALQKRKEAEERKTVQVNNSEGGNVEGKYMGVFELTAYCMGTKTATGTRPTPNRTIAVDPKVIPYGTKVYIEGYGTYIAEDCGGAVKGNIIDIYMKGYDNCIQFGRRKAKVYIVG